MLKKVIPLAMMLFTLIILTSCEEDTQTNVIEPTSGDSLPIEIQELIGGVFEKRAASNDEIKVFRKRKASNAVTQKKSCSLDSDAGCSNESTPEFLHYVSNCVTFPLPSSGGFNVVNTRGAISYYVDGDGDVNCDYYEDDLQAMIDGVVAQVGGYAWSITPSVFRVSSCRERSGANFIVFDLEVWVP